MNERVCKTVLKVFLFLIPLTLLIFASILIGLEHFTIVSFPELQPCANAHLGNQLQHPWGMNLISDQDELYLFKKEGIQARFTLYRFTDHKVEKVYCPKECLRFLCFADGCLYYTVESNENWKETIRCYNLKTQEDTALVTDSLSQSNATIEYAEDGSVFSQIFEFKSADPPKYIHIKGDKVLAHGVSGTGFHLGNQTCFLSGSLAEGECLTCVDRKSPDDPKLMYSGYMLNVFPFENGLLLHNGAYGRILEWIDTSGNVTSLFRVPCLYARSACNIYGDNVYFSFVRYEKRDRTQIGYSRFENDPLEGTYRLSLKDFSYQKINDQIFDGLYNFDDTGFYCTDENHNIYKMDFEGNVTPIYIKRRLLASLSE